MKGSLVPWAPVASEVARSRRAQCALCSELGSRYGLGWRLMAGPDLIFFKRLADAVHGEQPRLRSVACPLAVGLVDRPADEASTSAEIAAAVGLLMGAEKLRDDWQDEGSRVAGAVWRSSTRARALAGRRLQASGLDMAALEGDLASQRSLERGGGVPLHEAEEPTRSIAGRLFALAAPAGSRGPARALGSAIGAFLFHLDAIEDFEGDLEADRYNPLLRLHGPRWSQRHRDEASRVGRSALEEARSALEALEVGEERAWLEKVLVVGFTRRLDAALAGRPLSPTRSWWERLRTLAGRLSGRARRLLIVRWAMLQVLLGVPRVFADDTGAQDTGPQDTGPQDTGPQDTGPQDTGPQDSADTGWDPGGGSDTQDTGWDWGGGGADSGDTGSFSSGGDCGGDGCDDDVDCGPICAPEDLGCCCC